MQSTLLMLLVNLLDLLQNSFSRSYAHELFLVISKENLPCILGIPAHMGMALTLVFPNRWGLLHLTA